MVARGRSRHEFGETSVEEPAVTRDHTERMLQGFGCEVRARGGVATVKPPRELHAADITVPGDFSSAAFFIVAACVGAREPFTIRGVGVNPTRTGLLEMLALMGADLRLINHRTCGAEPVADIEVRPAKLRGARIPERLVPLAIDEFPALFVAAACAEGETLVTGAEELRVKESDRIAALAEGLAALGARVRELPDGLVVAGGARLRGARVRSHGDHRIAMALAVAAMAAEGASEIEGADCVAVSFPEFFALLATGTGRA